MATRKTAAKTSAKKSRPRRTLARARARRAPPRKTSDAIVLVDVDGTVADVSHRLHFIEGGRKNWKRFFSAMAEDEPIESMIDLVQRLDREFTVVILTGRPEDYRAETVKWLKANGVPFTRLLMRRKGDHRPDYVIKEEILKDIGQDNVMLAMDDRGPVCDMFRSHGVRVLEVKSDYENQIVNTMYEIAGGEAANVKHPGKKKRPVTARRAAPASARRRATPAGRAPRRSIRSAGAL